LSQCLQQFAMFSFIGSCSGS